MMKEPMEIVLVANDRYCRYAASVILSVLKHAMPEDRFRFHLLASGIRDSSRMKLEKTLSAYPAAELHWIPAKIPAEFQSIPQPRGVTAEALLRLLLPELLPDTQQVLYLDCDVIVQDSLSELWHIDLGNALLGGVPDYNTQLVKYANLLGLRPEEYINSGVVLMKLAAMRQFGTQKVVDSLQNCTIPLIQPDQDLLNLIYAGQIKHIDLRWNLFAGYFKHKVSDPQLRAKLIDAMRHPGILHFTGVRKPWTLKTSRHPFWEEYFHTIRGTVYAQEWRHFLKKYVLPKDRSVLP